MEGDGGDVQVSVESSWTVLNGSLESCVSVVFLDPQTNEPIISAPSQSSTRLVLVPPAEAVPCEITVKFQGRLCHVQSLYTSSTARICELYSRSNLETDPDYICTVKGWIPYEDNISINEDSEIDLKDATTKGEDDMLVKRSDSLHDSAQGVMSGVVSPITASNHVVDGDCQKSVYSSGEDSWVNVKLNGSCSTESACVSLTAPDLDNWHVPLNVDELIHLEDRLLVGSRGLAAEEKGLESPINFPDKSSEEKSPMQQIGQRNTCQKMFEAEVDLVDHNPWAAITIRLLSLQDKSVVEVDQMVFLVISGPVPEPPATTCQFEHRGPNSALFAMFLPSILQMAQGISGKSKDLFKSDKSSQLSNPTQDMVDDLSHAGGEEVNKLSKQDTVLEGVTVLGNTMPLPPPVENDTKCVASEIERSYKPEVVEMSSQETDADIKVSKILGDQALESGSNSNPVCNCKKFGSDIIASSLLTTFDAFSERFDRLESMCLRMESFLQKAFERLDQRIAHLEVQHRNDNGERACLSNQSGMLSDASVVQIPHNDDQVQPIIPLPHEFKSKEVSCELRESVTMQEHAVKEESVLNAVDSSSADIENLGEQAPSEIEELPSEPKVTLVSEGSTNREPVVSLDDAWASALSAFTTSLAPIISDPDINTSTSHVGEQFLGSSCNSASASTYYYPKGVKEGMVSGPSSHLGIKFDKFMTNDVDAEANDLDHAPTHGVGEEATCGEQMSPAECSGIFLPSDSTTLKPFMTSDFLVFQELRSAADQKIASGKERIDCIDSPEEKGILLRSHFGKPELDTGGYSFSDLKEVQSTTDNLDAITSDSHTQEDAQLVSPKFDVSSSAHSNSVLCAETLDDWAVVMGLKTRLLPVSRSSLVEDEEAASNFPLHNTNTSFEETLEEWATLRGLKTRLLPMSQSMSVEDQDAVLNSLSYNMCSSVGDCQKEINSSLLGGDLQYGFSDDKVASNGHADWQRSFPSCAESNASHAEKSDEESLCNAPFELDLLSRLILSEQREDSSSNEAEGPVFSKRPFTYHTTEEASSLHELLEDSSNYQVGGRYSHYSLCFFPQDFDAFPNDSKDTRWPNIFYLNDPELADEEVDTTVSGVDEKADTCEFLLQGNFSGMDSTWDLPSWPAPHNVGKDDKQTITVFPGFENLY